MAPHSGKTLSLSAAPSNRINLGWLFLALSTALVFIVSLFPAPYVIAKPGPVYDALGTVTVSSGQELPLISVVDTTSYPTDGQLNILTVVQSGNPVNQIRWIDFVMSWLDSSNSVYPLEQVYPAGTTVEDVREQNAVSMQNSQRQAVAAALRTLGYEFEARYVVHSLLEDSPAVGRLQEGDELLRINGEEVGTIDHISALLAENGPDREVSVTVLRAEKEFEVHFKPKLRDGVVAMFILLENHFNFPVNVQIQLENVGGSSAGLMFALGIIDKLTPGALTGGKIIAGTGAIDAEGTVWPIGGVHQKVYAAHRAGAEIFLLPQENCAELPEEIPGNMTVIAVGTLDEALEYVNLAAEGKALPESSQCSIR